MYLLLKTKFNKKMVTAKSEFIQSREFFFNNIVNKFPHQKLSNLIVSHKIEESIFKKFSYEVNNYFNLSKKFNLLNMTPNGKLVPKRELESEYNNILIHFREIFESMNLSNEISHFIIPAIRYKESNIDILNSNRSSRSELPHSDSWAGWGENTLLVNIPISGDIKNNKVVYYDLPNDIGQDLIEKRSFDEGGKYVERCKKLNLPYEFGNIYICDISVIHETSRFLNSKARLSIDIPIQFKYHKNIQHNVSKPDLITADEMKLLGQNFKLSFPSKMGQIDESEFQIVPI